MASCGLKQHEPDPFQNAGSDVVDQFLVLLHVGGAYDRALPIKVQADMRIRQHSERDIFGNEIRNGAEPCHQDGVDNAGHRRLLENFAVELDYVELVEIDAGQTAVGREERCVGTRRRHSYSFPFEILGSPDRVLFRH
jgi:hypothetical protein